MTRVLVTGGAGYVGSHAVLALLDAGIGVVVLDDLSTGMREAVPPGVPLVRGSTGDAALLREAFRRYSPSAVLHFAASLVVPESVARPLDYWRNNLSNTLVLTQSCLDAGIRRFVFSSTAAVYGQPDGSPLVDEDTPCAPINPYGASKLAAERALADAGAAHGLSTVVLRYFNVAGADPAGRAGQRRPGATHLVTVACEAALGKRRGIDVFGTDYPTPDGTGVRDYVHVTDLARAHVEAVRHLAMGGGSLTLNCGYGRGYSVLEVLRAVERVSGRPVPARLAPRRAGDPPALVARADRVREALGWRPAFDDLDRIVSSALAWEGRPPSPAGTAARTAGAAAAELRA
jgi:UDP-glucose 4-epimerase